MKIKIHTKQDTIILPFSLSSFLILIRTISISILFSKIVVLCLDISIIWHCDNNNYKTNIYLLTNTHPLFTCFFEEQYKSYCLSGKSCPILYSKLLYKTSQNIQYDNDTRYQDTNKLWYLLIILNRRKKERSKSKERDCNCLSTSDYSLLLIAAFY